MRNHSNLNPNFDYIRREFEKFKNVFHLKRSETKDIVLYFFRPSFIKSKLMT